MKIKIDKKKLKEALKKNTNPIESPYPKYEYQPFVCQSYSSIMRRR
jgi:hypothetical protein